MPSPSATAKPARSRIARLLSFPDPVNEVSARLVAGGVVAMSAPTIALDQPWITGVIAFGFWARVVTGPTLSPLAQLVTRVITPRLGLAPRPVPGPPKRFAQGMGAIVSTAAAVLALGFDATGPAYALLGLMIVFASLEAFLGFCLGCTVFGGLTRIGVVPARVCERCVVAPAGPGQGRERPAPRRRRGAGHSPTSSFSVLRALRRAGTAARRGGCGAPAPVARRALGPRSSSAPP